MRGAVIIVFAALMAGCASPGPEAEVASFDGQGDGGIGTWELLGLGDTTWQADGHVYATNARDVVVTFYVDDGECEPAEDMWTPAPYRETREIRLGDVDGKAPYRTTFEFEAAFEREPYAIYNVVRASNIAEAMKGGCVRV